MYKKTYLKVIIPILFFIFLLIIYYNYDQSNIKNNRILSIANNYLNYLCTEEYEKAINLLQMKKENESRKDLIIKSYKKTKPNISDFKVEKIIKKNDYIYQINSTFINNNELVVWKPYFIFKEDDELKIILNARDIPDELNENIETEKEENELDNNVMILE